MNTDGKDIVSNVWGSLQAELFSLSPGEARGIMMNCYEKNHRLHRFTQIIKKI
jgi:hypothetical protein